MEFISQPTGEPFCFPIACINACRYFDAWHPPLSQLVQVGDCIDSGVQYPEAVLECTPLVWSFTESMVDLYSQSSIVYTESKFNTPHACYHYLNGKGSYIVNYSVLNELVMDCSDVDMTPPGGYECGYVIHGVK